MTNTLSFSKKVAVLLCDEPVTNCFCKRVSAKSISYYVLGARYVFQVECVRGKLGHPALLTCIKLGFCHDIGKRVVISPYCKRMAS